MQSVGNAAPTRRRWEYRWLLVVGEQHEVLAPDPAYGGEFWYMPPGGDRQRVDDALEALGLDGWELVAVAPALYSAAHENAYRMYFKRPAV
jgi:hypothetical protein